MQQENKPRRFQIQAGTIKDIEDALTDNVPVEVKRERDSAVVIRLNRKLVSKNQLIEQEG